MNEIKVVNKHHKVGLSARHFYIGRPSTLGNPFEITHLVDRDDVIAAYKPWLKRKLQEGDKQIAAELDRIANMVMDNTGEPVYLVCYCAPKPCHGDVIKELILSAIAGSQGA